MPLPTMNAALGLHPNRSQPVSMRRSRRGDALPEDLRSRLEDFFKADFSQVKIFVGKEARAIGAIAFTHGEHLYFAPGRYDPNSKEGVRLLAHELAHVLQQRQGRVANPYNHGVALVDDPAMEKEADQLADQAVAALFPESPAFSAPKKPAPGRKQEPANQIGALQPANEDPFRSGALSLISDYFDAYKQVPSVVLAGKLGEKATLGAMDTNLVVGILQGPPKDLWSPVYPSGKTNWANGGEAFQKKDLPKNSWAQKQNRECAEPRVLDWAADEIGDFDRMGNPQVLYLYTQYETCSNCHLLIQDFLDKHYNGGAGITRIIVYDGRGKTQAYEPNS